MGQIVIRHLNVALQQTGEEILRDVDLVIDQGKVLYILGPNGAGKSVLLHTIMGSPLYQVVSGDIILLLQNKKIRLTKLKPEERARYGLFLTWQEPPVIPGLKVKRYLLTLYAKKQNKKVDEVESQFNQIVAPLLKKVGLPEVFLERDLFEGFSGGEKKRLEVLTLLLFKPKFVFLDELDSGLDIKSERNLFSLIYDYCKKNKCALTIVSHTFRITEYIPADKVGIMKTGRLKVFEGADILEKIKKTKNFDIV